MKAWSLCFLTIGILAASGPTGAEMAGEQGRPTRYGGVLTLPGGGECSVSTAIERVEFLLSSVESRYKLVRFRVENQSPSPIRFSLDEDIVELELEDGTRVRGILDLQAADGELWDSFDTEMREILAYPRSIRPGATEPDARVRPEVLYFFVFFPAESVTSLPLSFGYHVASTGETIDLRHRAVAARN